MKKRVAAYLIRLGVQKALGLLCYLLGTGFALYRPGLVYFIVYIAGTLLCSAILLRRRPETLAARGKVNTDSPVWDKVLLGLFWLVNYFLIYLLAGLGEDGARPLSLLFWCGLALCVLSGALSLWAMLENAYLESTARIQAERGQTVCRTGPYAFIRHPTYAAVIVNCIGIYMMFPFWSVLLASCFLCAVILLRTHKEDQMLLARLPGYADYSKMTQYRILPFVW